MNRFKSRIAAAGLLATSLAVFSSPAMAAQVLPGAGIGGNAGAVIDPFVLATRGDRLAFDFTSGTALSFAGSFTSAVYLNTLGTLDFYYQVARTGIGSDGRNNAIQAFTTADWDSFEIFAFRDGTDFDGDGGFSAAANPGDFTSRATRSFDGNVAGVDFGMNNLAGTENSTTYIFRTNATAYTSGTFGIIDGSTLQGRTFVPTAAIPEPATWAMMLLGFGILGFAMRRRSNVRTRVNFAMG